MSRQSGTELGLLRYRATTSILTPYTIILNQDMLRWNLPPYPISERYRPAPILGCLRAFSRLANTTPAGVLRFVQRYGVLALDPLVEEYQEAGHVYRRYTEPVSIYTRLGAIVRRLLAVLDHLTRGVPLTKKSRCPIPDHPDMVGSIRWDMQANYGLLQSEDYAPDEMRFALAGIIQDFWDASPPRLSTGTACEEMPGLWVQFAGPTSVASRWDYQRLRAVRCNQCLVTALPGQWLFKGSGDEGLSRAECHKRMVSYREYAEMFAGLLPFMEETRPSPLLSVLAFQLMEVVTLPDDTYYCKQCGAEFQPAVGKNAPRRDHGGCCSDECAIEWKRAYNKRLYQQRKTDL